MDDQALAQAIASAVEGEHRKMMGTGAPVAALGGGLVTILKWLRDNKVAWMSILSQLSSIMAILQGTAPWTDKIQALIALFFPTGAPPVGAPAGP
jgi:hypothetical protein